MKKRFFCISVFFSLDHRLGYLVPSSHYLGRLFSDLFLFHRHDRHVNWPFHTRTFTRRSKPKRLLKRHMNTLVFISFTDWFGDIVEVAHPTHNSVGAEVTMKKLGCASFFSDRAVNKDRIAHGEGCLTSSTIVTFFSVWLVWLVGYYPLFNSSRIIECFDIRVRTRSLGSQSLKSFSELFSYATLISSAASRPYKRRNGLTPVDS